MLMPIPLSLLSENVLWKSGLTTDRYNNKTYSSSFMLNKVRVVVKNSLKYGENVVTGHKYTLYYDMINSVGLVGSFSLEDCIVFNTEELSILDIEVVKAFGDIHHYKLKIG